MLNFNQADVRVLSALQRMRAPEMLPLLTFLKNQLEDSKSTLVVAEDAKFHQVQGRARYLQDFVDAVEQAGSSLEKMR